jgi:hypothetical protein
MLLQDLIINRGLCPPPIKRRKPMILYILDFSLDDIKPFGQFRTRYEYKKLLNNDYSFINMRTRIGGDIKISEEFSFRITIQDSRIYGNEISDDKVLEGNRFVSNSSLNYQSTDILESFIKFKKDWFGANFGRQRIAYGDERIIGYFDWSNISNSFDGIKLSFKKSDVFGFLLRERSVLEGPVEMPTNIKEKSYLIGNYNSFKYVDLYALYLRDDTKKPFAGVGYDSVYQNRDSLPANIYAIGLRHYYNYKQLFWTIEFIKEFGNAWSDKLDAFAFAIKSGLKFKPFQIFLEYDLATGSDTTDKVNKVRRTFYNFFPTNHIHYGYMDLFSLKNIKAIRSSISFNQNNFKISLDLWKFSLYSIYDWWYNAGGMPFLKTNQENLGYEIDLTMEYKFKNLILLGGYSHFLLNKDISGKNLNWGFLQALINF